MVFEFQEGVMWVIVAFIVGCVVGRMTVGRPTEPNHHASDVTIGDLELQPSETYEISRNPIVSIQEVGSVDGADSVRDAWEGFFGDAEEPKTARAELLISYVDGNGNETERRITTKEFDESLENGLLIAHCHLRGATRTFRFDRIKSCVDVTTGAVVTNVVEFLRGVYNSSEAATLDHLVDTKGDSIRTLIFVAKADGRMMSAERKVIAEALISWSGDDRLDHSSVDYLLDSLGVPTLNAFKAGVGRALLNEDVTARELLKLSEEIVHTQKKIVGAEQDALDFLKSKL